MPYYSKLNPDLEYDLDNWVVSFVNTGSSTDIFYGNCGHAKIVVEGLKLVHNKEGKLEKTLFVGEYHIVEAEHVPVKTLIPQVFRNTKCNYLVAFTERDYYNPRQEEQYSKVQTRSAGGIDSTEVNKMINAIKQEKTDIANGDVLPNFQYFGKKSLCGNGDAHNCTTWAEEKLNLIGLGKTLLTDSSKASPSLHAGNCSIV